MPGVALYIRIQLPDKKHCYAKPVYVTKGRLRPQFALVDGQPEKHPEGVYYLRYTKHGRRVFEAIGSDASLVPAALDRRNHTLNALALGIESPDEEEDAAPEAGPPEKKTLVSAIDDYLDEIKEHKSGGTYELRNIILKKHFLASCKAKYLTDVTRKDVLDFAAYLRGIGNNPLTVRTRVDHLQVFMHRCGIPSLLKGADLPQYTKKVVRAFSQESLDKMFAAATQDESDLLYFLLCTGTRRQEAMYACWTDVDFEQKTYTVTEHLDMKFKPKDREEGTFQIPEILVDALKARRERHPGTRLIFPNAKGRPDTRHLRILKMLALRVGVNCGFCIAKRSKPCKTHPECREGKSCARHPFCKHVFLHKMRKTFASKLHRNGLPPKTLMRYLRHSNLETTLKYIADEETAENREIVNAAFGR